MPAKIELVVNLKIAKAVERGSHAIYVSRPDAVAAIITKAAEA